MDKKMDEKNKIDKEPQGQESEEPELREFSPEELEKIFEEHSKWLQSEGKKGREAFLRYANLQEADIWDSNLQEANLGGANLTGAGGLTVEQISEVQNLEGAIFR
jgi:hypothetical protein